MSAGPNNPGEGFTGGPSAALASLSSAMASAEQQLQMLQHKTHALIKLHQQVTQQIDFVIYCVDIINILVTGCLSNFGQRVLHAPSIHQEDYRIKCTFNDLMHLIPFYSERMSRT